MGSTRFLCNIKTVERRCDDLPNGKRLEMAQLQYGVIDIYVCRLFYEIAERSPVSAVITL